MNREQATLQGKEIIKQLANIESVVDFFNHDGYIDYDELDAIGIRYNSGCTRAVFWFDNDFDEPEYVFKIDLDIEKSYCQREYENYKSAEKEGLAKFFAEIVPVGEFIGRTVYAMEFAEVNEDYTYDDYYSKRTRFCDNKDMFEEEAELISSMDDNEIALDIFYYYYPEEDVAAVADFSYRNEINDIHLDNIGYIKEKIVLIDYCGYGVL